VLLWGIIFGSIGMGYAVYGSRQRHALARACGIGLMVLPIFLTPLWLLIAICCVLCAVPLVIRS